MKKMIGSLLLTSLTLLGQHAFAASTFPNSGNILNNSPVNNNDSSAAANSDTIEKGDLAVKWIQGSSRCSSNTDPAIQIHKYNDNLTIFRQNKCVNYEGPFMYLFFGSKKAILFDTGATKSASQFPIQQTVEEALVDHYGADGRANIELIVAHTHAHGDHIQGDSQFKGQAHTTVVGLTPSAVAKFFGLNNWPKGVANYDLGDRVLNILPIPGHEPSHIAIYDAQTGILQTGDSLYPGRLYVQDWDAYRTSISTLLKWVADKPVTHVLGNHIEMSTTPGKDYPIGSTYQPAEHDLPLSLDTLKLLNSRLLDLGAEPTYDVQDDFIIYPN